MKYRFPKYTQISLDDGTVVTRIVEGPMQGLEVVIDDVFIKFERQWWNPVSWMFPTFDMKYNSRVLSEPEGFDVLDPKNLQKFITLLIYDMFNNNMLEFFSQPTENKS